MDYDATGYSRTVEEKKGCKVCGTTYWNTNSVGICKSCFDYAVERGNGCAGCGGLGIVETTSHLCYPCFDIAIQNIREFRNPCRTP